MKKTTAIILAVLLVVGAGIATAVTLIKNNQDPEPEAPATKINIGYFAGTTGIGMAKMISDASDKYTFQIYDGPNQIKAALAAGDIDIAALPTNAAPGFYTGMEGNLQLLAINTLGVLHICTNGYTVNSLSDLEGLTIYSPEQAPKLVLEYILAQHGVNATVSLEYNLDTLPNALKSGIVSVAVLPEPKATATKIQSAGTVTISSLDLTAAWDAVSDTPLVQGCVVVRKNFATANQALISTFLSDYEASIAYVSDPLNIDDAAQMVVDAGILPALPIAKQAIPRSNITFITGEEMKAAAKGFYSALSIASPTDDFYYISAEATAMVPSIPVAEALRAKDEV